MFAAVDLIGLVTKCYAKHDFNTSGSTSLVVFDVLCESFYSHLDMYDYHKYLVPQHFVVATTWLTIMLNNAHVRFMVPSTENNNWHSHQQNSVDYWLIMN